MVQYGYNNIIVINADFQYIHVHVNIISCDWLVRLGYHTINHDTAAHVYSGNPPK